MADATRRIIDDLLELLATLPSVPPGNVFEDPTSAIADGRLPAVAVEPSRNPAEPLGESHESGWIDRHRFQVAITGLALTPADRDQIVLEVKRAVTNAQHIGRRQRYVDTEYGRTTEGAIRPYGARLFFEIEYLTPNAEPDRLV